MMGFLHKLWDETLAGPAPETGLGKLRKYESFSGRSSSPAVAAPGEEMVISRSITVLRTKSDLMRRNLSVDTSSGPGSPAAGSAPGTPFTPGTPRGDFRRLRRRNDAQEHAEPTSPTAIDWIVISALDR